MTMLHGQHREVRYALPQKAHATLLWWKEHPEVSGMSNMEVPILSEPSVSLTEGLPVSRWIPGGFFPARALVRLYVPEEEK